MNVTFDLDPERKAALEKIAAKWPCGGITQDEAVKFAVLDFIRRNTHQAMEAPVYLDFYVECKGNEEGAFAVHFIDPSGESDGYDSYLRLGTSDDLVQRFSTKERDPFTERPLVPAIYVDVQHELSGSLSAYDCEEKPYKPTLTRARRRPLRKFCRATVCFTPQISLF